jgi:hypothetical protein
MNRTTALAELVANFADPALLRFVNRRDQTSPQLVQAAFAIEHGTILALALSSIFRDGLIVVEHDGEPISLHAACGAQFFDSYGLHTPTELIAEWADFYQEPVGNFSLRPSNEGDTEPFEIDLECGQRAADLRDELFERCGPAIAVLQR